MVFIRLFNWRHGNNPLLPIDGDRLACVFNYGISGFQWPYHIYRTGNYHPLQTNGAETWSKNGPWNVTNLDDLYGSCHEFNGFFSDRRGYTKLVGRSYYVGRRVYYTAAIQLLALESAWKRLLRLKVNWGKSIQ